MRTGADKFGEDCRRYAADAELQARIRKSLDGYRVRREKNQGRFQDWTAARDLAARRKDAALDNLGGLLEAFAARLESRGTRIFWAEDAQAACAYIAGVAKAGGVKRVIKSKSMVTEEIHLNGALEKEGVEALETDLGEYIVQLRGERPFHIVTPALHLDRHIISRLFRERLGGPDTTEPEELTAFARKVLREKFLAADMGITGANFAVADPGLISITENEGNARLTTALPRIHVAVLGIEKIVPNLEDLALFLQVLPASATGQMLSVYNTLISGPAAGNEVDGPREFHVVLLDNGRSRLLGRGRKRRLLACIRCGACIYDCPVYQTIGGHAYGTTYQGPIGCALTPELEGPAGNEHLASACTLCGRCAEICPVRISSDEVNLLHRRENAEAKPDQRERLAFRLFAFGARHPWLFRAGRFLAALLSPLHRLVDRRRIDPVRGWTEARALPRLPLLGFRARWRWRKLWN